MAHTEQTTLDKAIERAGRLSIKVLASGRIKSTGQRFWLVSSQTHPERPHIVFLHADTGRLSCDCPAGSHGRICVHRAAVHMQLTVQAARFAALDAQVEAALREAEETSKIARLTTEMEAIAMAAAETAALTRKQAQLEQWERESRERDAAPLYRDNRPFSIFRS